MDPMSMMNRMQNQMNDMTKAVNDMQREQMKTMKEMMENGPFFPRAVRRVSALECIVK